MTKYRKRGPFRDNLGRRSAGAVLTPDEVRVIRQKDEFGMWLHSTATLCSMYLVSGETIRRIRRGTAWAWLTDGLDDEDIRPAQPSTPPSDPAAEESLEKLKAKLREVQHGSGGNEQEEVLNDGGATPSSVDPDEEASGGTKG